MSIEKLDQYSPQDWGSQVDYDAWSESKPTSQAFIHWGGPAVKEPANDGNVNSEKSVLRAYETFHLGKGWQGLAYDWAVGQSGTLYRIRGFGRSAATSGDVDGDGIPNNVEGEAILCIIGEGQSPSVEMLNTLDKVLDALQPKELFGHQEAKGTKTACPGGDLMDFINVRRNTKPKKKPVKKPSSTKNWTEKIVAELGTQRVGDRNASVKRIQALLNLTKMHSLKTDGMFGRLTEQAVSQYQEHFNLGVDGVVGPQTWKHLLLNKKI